MAAEAAGRAGLASSPVTTPSATPCRAARLDHRGIHAVHPLGLGAPIVRDGLYGRAAERFALHAKALAFVHPPHRQRIGLE